MNLNLIIMKTLHVYINYNGNCAEAFVHYAKVLKSELSESLTYADAPPNTGMPQVAEEFHNRIMHCTLPLNENVTLMGSDAAGDACARFVQGNNYAVSLHVENRKEADRVFNGLSEGGAVLIPIAETFWSSCWGMCTDAFGVQWMVSSPL